MNERIKELRLSLSLTQSQFAEKIGLKKPTLSLIENGRGNVTERTIKDICREFNVNYLWLTSGKGEMFSDLPKTLFDELAFQYDLSEEEKELVRDFLALSKEERAIVMKFLKPQK